ncbi:hypothetical protein QCA50_000610 [Cerrena zonata]|uniref:Fungal-type protein kinase domain-containing protein n=1 Tax=Cerrena zonata TaxID=2478898 RepID=A0AAW0H082_9APHY
MVFLPRFWGGLPYPPSYLVDGCAALRARDEINISEPPTVIRKCPSVPNIMSSKQYEVVRLLQSEPPTPVGMPLDMTPVWTDELLVKGALTQVLQDKIDIEYDVINFVQHVLKFTPQDIPRRKDGYLLDKESCAIFSRRKYLKEDGPDEQVIKGERACCHAFQSIVWDLIRQLQDKPNDQQPFPAVLAYLHDHVVADDFASYKPDFVYGPSVEPQLQNWDFIGGFGEMKKSRDTNAPGEHARAITNDKLQKLTLDWMARRDTNGKPTSKSSEVPEIPERTRKRKAKWQPISRSNRKVNMGWVTPHTPATAPNTRHLLLATDTEIQMLKYVNELLSHGIRTYAFGYLLQDTSMSLWYIDRMGIASSKSFDIFRNPELLLLVVSALYFSDHHALGFNPLVEYPKGATHEGAILKLPLPLAIGDEGTKSPSPVEFDLRVSSDTPLVVAHGALGRGTTVIPLRARGSAKKLWGDENLVVKLSWPSVDRKSEADIIRIVRKKLGEHDKARVYVRNIVELKCSSEISAVDLKLPRAFMDLPEPSEPRVWLRALVMKEYLPLECIGGLDDFKLVYIYVFEAHHWVYNVAGVLHGDVSVDNIMFYYDDRHQVVGVLTDWDLSSVEKEPTYLRDAAEGDFGFRGTSKSEATRDTTSRKSETCSQYKMGKGPFLALDLSISASNPTPHQYRHDLESFFYVLCFFCAKFRFGNTEIPKAHFAYLPDWENDTITPFDTKKKKFFTNYGTFKAIFKDADPVFRPLLEQWITPLHRGMFWDVPDFTLKLQARSGRLSFARDDKDEEEIQRLLKKIQEATDKANDTITYERFRDVLST